MQITGKISLAIYILSILIFSISGILSSYAQTPPKSDHYTHSEDLIISSVPTKAPKFISVYRTSSGTITTVSLETYVKRVVACEVPESFHNEALKSQAVAARTYAVAKIYASRTSGCPEAHPLAPVCDSTHCQVYDDSSLIKRKSANDKIANAVKSTESQMLYYNGDLVMQPLFHASSGGKTENSEDVFVSAVPYLKSVSSPYEKHFSRNGHGVGMSQQGANGMANAGYSYREILSHYYKGTVVQ